MSIPHETARVRSGDVTLHYRRLGRAGGVPLLIVHGLSYFSYDWLPAAQTLGAGREVIAMDMRGFGDSEWSGSRDYAVPTMGADILAVLEHAGWSRALLVGHSMGGRSTTWVAAKHATRVAGLALIDYSPENAPAGARRVTERLANTPDAFPSIDEAMRYFAKQDRARFAAYLRHTDEGYLVKRDTHFRDQFRRALQTGERPKLGVDMWQLLAEVRCPILSMRGTRSDMYAPETAQNMKAANPRLELAEVDAGHDIAGDNLPGFLSTLEAWIRKMGSDPISRGHER